MKILDKGTTKLDNAEVLKWIKDKRSKHEKIRSSEKHLKANQRTYLPRNFVRSLDKHEVYLTRASKPFANNPAYNADNRKSLAKLAGLLEERILAPIEAECNVPDMSIRTLEQRHKEYENKELLESELLTIANLRPSNVAMLQPMIEMVSERLTEDEQQVVVDCVREVYGGAEAEG